MCGFGGGRGLARALVSGSLVVGLLGGVPVCSGGSAGGGHVTGTPRPRTALEDKIPDLKSARLGARERLGRPECQAVLTDFRAVTGQRLDEVLRASGRTAQEQLDVLELESGLGRHACDRGVTMAFTRIRSSVVSICLRPFTLLRREEQEAVLIHEMLHSLGLGENPPESVAITARVIERCER